MDPIRGIAFDSYGTLFQTRPLEQAAEETWPGQGAELARRWREKQLDYAWVRSLTGSYLDFWHLSADALEGAAAELDLVLSPAIRSRLMRTYLTLPAYPDVRPALTALQHLPSAVVSEGTPAMLQAVIQRNGLSRPLHVLVSADQVRSYKPAAPPYRWAAQRLGFSPAEILYVTAHSWDLAGAAAVGFQTAWLNRQGEPPEPLGVTPDREIRSLEELAES